MLQPRRIFSSPGGITASTFLANVHRTESRARNNEGTKAAAPHALEDMIRVNHFGSRPIDIPKVIANPAITPKLEPAPIEPAPKDPVKATEAVPSPTSAFRETNLLRFRGIAIF
jgi:hypothetical protein